MTIEVCKEVHISEVIDRNLYSGKVHQVNRVFGIKQANVLLLFVPDKRTPCTYSRRGRFPSLSFRLGPEVGVFRRVQRR